MSSKLNDWDERDYHGTTVHFIDSSDKWFGDDYNTWVAGLSIFVEEEGSYAIFEDDGYGTGAHVTDYSGTLEEAKLYCENLLIGDK
jgi:hypothetical protein